jgi:hypothetical protein
MKRIIHFNRFITESFGDKIIDIAKSDMELARQLAISQGSTLDEIFKSHFSEVIGVEFFVDEQWQYYDLNIKFKISDLKINQEDEIELYCEVDKSSYTLANFSGREKYYIKEIFDNLDLSDFYNSDDIISELRNKRKYLEVSTMIVLEENITSKSKELEEFFLQIFLKCY